MSEYQYYEFLAVDRPLTKKQISEVREYSSRADISSTSFVNEYNWANFRGDPDVFVTRYFDVMVYFANWGTHRLLIGLPSDAADLRAWREYESEYGMELRKLGERVLVDFSSDAEDYDEYDEAAGVMASLAPIREELLGGDLRPLYLGWLAGVGMDLDEAEGLAAPVPPGLGELTPAQQRLVEFLRVDEDLLQAAVKESSAAAAPAIEFDDWLESLPQAEKDELLRSLATGKDPAARAKLTRRYQLSLRDGQSERSSARRPLEELLETARQIREAREAAERELAARRRARQQAQQAAEREEHLKKLMAREAEAWRKVEQIVGSKQAKSYDEAVSTLRDLRDVAIRKEALDAFAARVRALRDAHRSKYTFVQRLDKAGLVSPQ